MEMSDNEVCIVKVGVEGKRREHSPGQPAHNKDAEKPKYENERSFQIPFAGPECCHPAEDLDAVWHNDQHARRGKNALAELRKRRDEHVVHPNAEANERCSNHRQNKRCISESLSPGKSCDDHRDHSSGWNENDVNLRVTEEPEEVLPHYRIAALSLIEKMGAYVGEAVHRQQ